MRTGKIAYLGLLVALAFIFSYIETLVPISLGIPGAKLGLANLVIIITLYLSGEKQAFLLSMVRIVLVGFTFSNPASMIYSLAGAVFSFAVMAAAKKTKKLSVTGVSVLGGIFHNLGQIVAAMVVLETASLIYYLPALLLMGIAAGVVIGVLAGMMIPRLQKVVR